MIDRLVKGKREKDLHLSISTLFRSLGLWGYMCLILAVTPAIAQIPQVDRWIIGAWNGALIEDSQGFFERCVTAVEFQNGITFSVSLDSAARLEIRFTNDKWNLVEGQPYSVQLAVDGKPVVGRITGIATRRSQILVEPGNDYRLLASLRRGLELQVRSDIASLDGVRLPLRDSAAALHRMTQCFPGAVPRPSNVAGPAGASKQVAMRPEANIAVLGKAIGVMEGAVLPDPNPPSE
jgi:hypothetical protein